MSLLVKLWPFGWVRYITRPDVGAYLNRYTLRKQNDSGANPWRLYLHQFLAPDGAGHHNHPSTWGFSVVLWGSYTEEVLETKYCYETCCNGWCGAAVPVVGRVRSRRVRWFNWIPATKYHRITELHPGPGARSVWTLFICGPLTGRGWGFWEAGIGHVPHTTKEHTKVTTQVAK
jgi:hypothetical protein